MSHDFIPKLVLSRGIKELSHLHLKKIGLDLSLRNSGLSKVNIKEFKKKHMKIIRIQEMHLFYFFFIVKRTNLYKF